MLPLDQTMEGIVIKAHSGAYEVQVGKQCYTCALRHQLIEDEKRRLAETKEMPYVDLVAVGDRVRWRPGTYFYCYVHSGEWIHRGMSSP